MGNRIDKNYKIIELLFFFYVIEYEIKVGTNCEQGEVTNTNFTDNK